MSAPIIGSSAQSAARFSANTWAVPLPAGIVAGDLLVIIINMGSNSGVAPHAPTGWNSGPSESTPFFDWVWTFWKIADGSEGATQDVSFFNGASLFTVAGQTVSLRITGHDSSTPLNGTPGSGGASTGTVAPDSVSALTTSVADCLGIVIANLTSSATTNRDFTGPAGWTKVVDIGSQREQIEVWTQSLPVAGSTGSMSWACSSSTPSRGYVALAIAPAPAAPTAGQLWPHGKKGTSPSTGQLFPRGVIL